jgi:hypothetical protein
MRAVKVPALIEPVPIVDDFVQGIACIERVGPCARFVLFCDQTIVEAGNLRARVIVRKIIMPMESLPIAMGQTSDFLAARAFANVFRIRG